MKIFSKFMLLRHFFLLCSSWGIIYTALICCGYCSQPDYHDVITKTEVILQKNKSNYGQIRTWSGAVETTSTSVIHEEATQSEMSHRAFAYDKTKDWCKTILKVEKLSTRKGNEFVEELRNFSAVLWKDNVFYKLNYYTNPDNSEERPLKQLVIGAALTSTEWQSRFFDPFAASSWQSNNPNTVTAYLEDYLRVSSTEGFPFLSITQDGQVITFSNSHDDGWKSTYSFDISKGGNVILAEQSFKEKALLNWQAEYQEVDNVWIPLRIKKKEYFTNGTSNEETQVWKDQIINQNLDAEMSPTTLGVRQGDMAHDLRTNQTYIITDPSYPLSEGDEVIAKSRYSNRRLIILGVNIVLISIIAVMFWRSRQRKIA